MGKLYYRELEASTILALKQYDGNFDMDMTWKAALDELEWRKNYIYKYLKTIYIYIPPKIYR